MNPEQRKYPKIRPLDVAGEAILSGEAYVFEKLDGGNCQLRSFRERLLATPRSGNRPYNPAAHPWLGAFEKWANRFYARHSEEYCAPLSELLPEHLILFGEWLSPHTIEYDPQFTDKFYLIDVYDTRTGHFIEYPEAVQQATVGGLLPLETTPVLYRGQPTRQSLEALANAQSSHYSGTREGVVIKNYGTQAFAKLLSVQFSEVDSSKRGSLSYLTSRRLEKSILRVRDEGSEITYDAVLAELRGDLEEEAGIDIPAPVVDRWLQHHFSPALEKLRSRLCRK